MDLNRLTTPKGANPFDYIRWNEGKGAPLSADYPTHDWVLNSGRQNLSAWVEAAAKKAGR